MSLNVLFSCEYLVEICNLKGLIHNVFTTTNDKVLYRTLHLIGKPCNK